MSDLAALRKATPASASAARTRKSSYYNKNEDPVTRARRITAELLAEPPATGKVTIGSIEKLGTEKKIGYLSKQSKILGRYVNSLSLGRVWWF